MRKIYVVGSINMDLVIHADAMPEAGMTLTGDGFMTNPGGKGANQAVAAAKCGGDVYMVGAVGKAFGSELVETLRGYGVNTDDVCRVSEISSGIAVIMVTHGENRIILDRGANAFVSSRSVRNALAQAQSGDWLIAQLEIPVETVLEALKIAHEKQMRTILNPAPACPLPDEVWQLTDYFIPNQTETQFYTGIYPDTEETAREAARYFLSRGVKNVVITMGSKGALAVSENNVVFAKAYRVNAIDTTAAGDTFVGVLAVKLSESADMREALDFANCASSLTVTRNGAQQSIPTRREIEKKAACE